MKVFSGVRIRAALTPCGAAHDWTACKSFLTWPETSVYEVFLLHPLAGLRSAQAEEITAIPPRHAEVWAQIVALKVRPPRPQSSALERLIRTVMRDNRGASYQRSVLRLCPSCAPLTGMCVALELKVFSTAGTHAEPESPTEHEHALYSMQIFFYPHCYRCTQLEDELYGKWLRLRISVRVFVCFHCTVNVLIVKCLFTVVQ